MDAHRARGGRVILHFGAVDYQARVWVNDFKIITHEGGHTPFSADITFALRDDGPQVVAVWAEDDPHDLEKPRGKQDWKREPHGIWYPRTTGIWQTVWLEPVAKSASSTSMPSSGSCCHSGRGWRQVISTRQPSATKRRAQCKPMRWAAPVIRMVGLSDMVATQ